MSTALINSSIKINLALNTVQELQAFCAILAKTDMVPKHYQGKPDSILVAAMHGQELGLPVLQALQSIAVINGVPSIYGDAGLAIVRSSGLLDEFDEWLEIDGQRVKEIPNLIEAEQKGHRIVQWCLSKRKGAKTPRVTTYSVNDAKTAKLWLKKGYNGQDTPWCTAPSRMLMFRARGFNLRDEFGDVLKGMKFVEEVQDYDVEMAPTTDGSFVMTADTTVPADPKKSNLGELLKKAAPPESAPMEAAPAASPAAAPPAEPAPAEPPVAPGPPSESELLLAEIKESLATLGKKAKGTAMINGIRTVFKLKGAEMYPADPVHWPLYAKALKEMVSKL